MDEVLVVDLVDWWDEVLVVDSVKWWDEVLELELEHLKVLEWDEEKANGFVSSLDLELEVSLEKGKEEGMDVMLGEERDVELEWERVVKWVGRMVFHLVEEWGDWWVEGRGVERGDELVEEMEKVLVVVRDVALVLVLVIELEM